MKKALLVSACFFSTSFYLTAFSQAGCTDPMANSYSSTATINNGSCTYNSLSYTPIIKVNPMDDIINESSGLQWAGNALWTFNDGGGAAAVYRIDTITKTIIQIVNLEGATNVDWEDIAFDGTNLYIGDFGNNANFARTNLKIYKFPLSLIPDPASQYNVTIPAAQIKVINFTYKSQDQPPLQGNPANRAFDCEAMIIDEGMIHLFSKNWIDSSTTHFVINSLDAGSYEATSVETLPAGYLVTAADKVEGKNIILLMGYQVTPESLGRHYLTLLTGYSGTSYFSGNKRKITLPIGLIMGQAEGLTFRNEGYGYISNERVSTVSAKLQAFNISNLLPPTVLALKLEAFNISNENGMHKITWNFNGAMQKVQMQASTNGRDFTTLKSFTNSQAILTFVKPNEGPTWYRLAWQQNDGSLAYSKMIEIGAQVKDKLGSFQLSSSGILRFKLEGSIPKKIMFKLMAPDGTLLNTSASRSYNSGMQYIQLTSASKLPALVYLVAITNGVQVSYPVVVNP